MDAVDLQELLLQYRISEAASGENPGEGENRLLIDEEDSDNIETVTYFNIFLAVILSLLMHSFLKTYKKFK